MAEAQVNEQLKAERIQSKLKAERIQVLLSELPGWEAGEDGASLTRTYDLPSLRASGLFATAAVSAERGSQLGEVISYGL